MRTIKQITFVLILFLSSCSNHLKEIIMTIKNHIVLIAVAASAWLGFLLIGTPTDYYQNSLIETKILL